MRITARQLRQIIKEEVENMMSEEEVTFSDAEAPVVKPQGTGLIPTAILKRCGDVLANMMGSYFASQSVPVFGPDGTVEPRIDVSAGDQVTVQAELTQLDMVSVLGGRVSGVIPRISIKSITVNGQPQKVDPGLSNHKMTPADIADITAMMKGQPRTSSQLKASDRTQLQCTFTVSPEANDAILDALAIPPNSKPAEYKQALSRVRSVLRPDVKAGLQAVG